MRVLVTGLGGELGVRTANLLAARGDVEAVTGLDLDPPRRRLHPSVTFHRVDPRDRDRVVSTVRDLAPTHVVHLGVYEPNARTGPQLAAELNHFGTLYAVGAAADAGHLERVVVRSGTEVYGRRRGAPTRPDEGAVPDPTSPFGHQLLDVEQLCVEAGWAAGGAAVALLRMAPVTGAAMASPLGRYLRLPAVAVHALSDPTFALLHQTDAAGALAAALLTGPDGPVNVVGPGATTPWRAVRIGGRIPVPVAGPPWVLARLAAELLGAPLPSHVRELLIRGRVADGSSCKSLLGFEPSWSTEDVVRDVYDWPEVTYLPTGTAA